MIALRGSMRTYALHYIQSGAASENSFAAFPFLAVSVKGWREAPHKYFVEGLFLFRSRREISRRFFACSQAARIRRVEDGVGNGPLPSGSFPLVCPFFS